GRGLLVSSFDGRPVKVEGNPQHPGARSRTGKWGAADTYAQAQPLSMYDPDRSRSILERSGRGGAVARDEAWLRTNVIEPLQQADGSSMAVLCEPSASPTILRLREEFEAKGGTWYTYGPTSETPRRAAMQAAFGKLLRPIYDLGQAMVLVSLDDDYAGKNPAHTRYAADWAKLRVTADPESGMKMSRTYHAECGFSITGASADIRRPVRPSHLVKVAQAMAAMLGIGSAPQDLTEDEQKFVEAAVKDLKAAGKNGLVAFGAHLPVEVQVLAMAMNEKLGCVGTTIRYVDEPIPEAGSIQELARRMSAGEVENLVILGGNPVYDAPADCDFAAAMAQVPMTVHLSLYDDETSLRSRVHVPQAHFFEAFGDTRGFDGTIALTQPLIFPLFNGVAAIELLAQVLGREQTGSYELVRETMQDVLDASTEQAATDGESDDPEFAALTGFDRDFRRVLHNGVVPESSSPVASGLSVSEDAVQRAIGFAMPEGAFEVTFSQSSALFDGRFANNGWLQEAPECMTKLCWDNAALMNIQDAEVAGIKTKDLIDLTINGRTVEMPVYLMPGQPRGVIGLTMGYGRTRAGSIGTKSPESGGFDVYPARTTQSMWQSTVQFVKQGKTYPLAMTQNHYLIDETGFKERDKRVGEPGKPGYIIREATFDQHKDYFKKTKHSSNDQLHGGHGSDYPYPANKKDHTLHLQIFQPPMDYNTPHAWGMSIDINACIGCNACVVACQSENNVPVVGKDSVMNNREMHWLRVDRYFKAEGEDMEAKKKDDNPDVAFQPVACVHCETAPCEQVCPVAATVHDTEGLNTMVYNRCIGTRYCGNNCPYKVRRFNYLDYHVKDPRGSVLDGTYIGIPDQQTNEIDAIKQMVFNPEVTVRMRGIMEKCTYCTQRIKQKTIWRSNRGEEIQDYDILTACQQAC
ncbi:MAG: 4Fe-4S dicluster domain-containing protein, partial [Planctomycetota bacterium]